MMNLITKGGLIQNKAKLDMQAHSKAKEWTPQPQGAYLGGTIFIIKYNGALLRPPFLDQFKDLFLVNSLMMGQSHSV